MYDSLELVDPNGVEILMTFSPTLADGNFALIVRSLFDSITPFTPSTLTVAPDKNVPEIVKIPPDVDTEVDEREVITGSGSYINAEEAELPHPWMVTVATPFIPGGDANTAEVDEDWLI